MVGGGCRGLTLARDLVAEGHAVRAVTRRPEARGALEAAGCECWIGTPDVIGTLRYALDNVTLLLWLLGTATGPAEKVAALHGSRLRMMLEKTADTTVRGVVYEAAHGRPRADRGRRGGGAPRPAHERDPVRAHRRRPGRPGGVAGRRPGRHRRAAHRSSRGCGLTSGAPGRARQAARLECPEKRLDFVVRVRRRQQRG
jgi:hypothetical protein